MQPNQDWSHSLLLSLYAQWQYLTPQRRHCCYRTSKWSEKSWHHSRLYPHSSHPHQQYMSLRLIIFTQEIFYRRKTPKGSFMPLFPLHWITAMACFTACPLLKYINFKDCRENSIAWLITRAKKSEHITPVLINLHWLPIEHRAIFKLLLYTYKHV